MSFIKHKEQSKKHWLLMIAIFINLFFISLLIHPLFIHADIGNGADTETDSDIVAGGTDNESIKALLKNEMYGTGWLVYMVDSDGNVVSDRIVYAHASGSEPNSNTYVTTRYGNRPWNMVGVAYWSPPMPFEIGPNKSHGFDVKTMKVQLYYIHH